MNVEKMKELGISYLSIMCFPAKDSAMICATFTVNKSKFLSIEALSFDELEEKLLLEVEKFNRYVSNYNQ